MGVAALAGLYAMLMAGMVAAAIIAICEFTWRKRKLAVDENVSCFFPEQLAKTFQMTFQGLVLPACCVHYS